MEFQRQVEWKRQKIWIVSMKRERKCQKAQIDKTTADGMAQFWTQAIMFEKKEEFRSIDIIFFSCHLQSIIGWFPSFRDVPNGRI